MFRLAFALLLLFPSIAWGQTVKLPKEIVATGKLILVSPEFSPGAPLAVEFVVFGDRKAPEYASFGSTVLIAEPDPDDEITLVCYALFEGNKLSKPAVAKIKPRASGGSVPPAGPANPPTTPGPDREIPANVSGLHVILVVDPAAVPPEIAALARGENAVTKALAARKSWWYVRNSTDSLLTNLQASLQGKRLPVLVVIDSTRKLLAAEEVIPAGADTAKRLISQIASIAGRK